MELKGLNKFLRHQSPAAIVEWAMALNEKTVITTNFRPYEAAILHAVTLNHPKTQVIWCDTGYNTLKTYKNADAIIKQLGLNVDLFVPKQTMAYRNMLMGIPTVDDPKHKEFSYQVKLEPFERAMKKHAPKVWFTNLRKHQTAFRDSIDILSLSKDGVLKVSPFYHYTDEEMEEYMTVYNLPNELDYYDPTKAVENRECGIHN
ncbi:MAG: phosphoadenosine phosphosulfate reductase family protein [Salibacteraceae bacterium]